MSCAIFSSCDIKPRLESFFFETENHLKVHFLAMGFFIATSIITLAMGLSGVGVVPTSLFALSMISAVIIVDIALIKCLAKNIPLPPPPDQDPFLSNSLFLKFKKQAEDQSLNNLKLLCFGKDSFFVQDKDFHEKAVRHCPELLRKVNILLLNYNPVHVIVKGRETTQLLSQLYNHLVFLEKYLNGEDVSKFNFNLVQGTEQNQIKQLLASKAVEVLGSLSSFFKEMTDLHELEKGDDKFDDLTTQLYTLVTIRIRSFLTTFDSILKLIEQNTEKQYFSWYFAIP